MNRFVFRVAFDVIVIPLVLIEGMRGKGILKMLDISAYSKKFKDSKTNMIKTAWED